ncbi:MAG: DUF86 domain-containing protein [Phototrophicaceae bacterium]
MSKTPHAIEWRKLITFRDFLAHNYECVAYRYIWQTVQDVPALHQAFVKLLADGVLYGASAPAKTVAPVGSSESCFQSFVILVDKM